MAACAPTAFAQQAQPDQPVQTAPAPAPAPASRSRRATPGPTTLNEVVVTGSTSKRTLLNASVAVTAVNQEQLDQKAPRGTDDVLELVPGIYVQDTAGPVSNNYSVRGLPGDSQEFIRLEEDGMPAVYGGLNDDEVFQYDLSIDRVEAIEGGTSGILTPNAAGASINFISRPLNFDQAGGIARITGASYGDERADLWYSAPIKNTILGDNVAFAVSGYFNSTKGVRSSPFTYQTYHFKAQLEKKFDSGGYVRLTYKRWDEHDPYYADQPYAYSNGKVTGVPGLNTQFGNIIGSGFGSITAPDSCAAGECMRTFSEQKASTRPATSTASTPKSRSTTPSRCSPRCATPRPTGTSTACSPAPARATRACSARASYLNPATSPHQQPFACRARPPSRRRPSSASRT